MAKKKKAEFMRIKFHEHKIIAKFDGCFYHTAQVLLGTGAMANFYVKIALQLATKLSNKLH